MDASIRQLILYSNSVDEVSGVNALLQAFKSLRQAFNDSKTTDGADTCGSDLFVQCAEVAYKLKQDKVCQECLEMYFNGVPLTNQFLCRAYLCQAQLLAPKSADDLGDFETSVVYLLKAISFAKDKSRYHFIVYNASVLYWKIARPFLREGSKAVLQQSLHQIVKALELIDDQDHDWRATLMITLIESYVDGGNIKEATAASQAAARFCTTKAPSKYKDVLALQIKNKLVDINKLAKDVGSVPEFSAFLKLQKIKLALSGGKSNFDLPTELQKLIAVVSGKPIQPSTPASKPTSRSKKNRTSLDESPVPSEESLKALQSASPIHRMSLSTPILDTVEVKKFFRPPLLIEIARLCVEVDQVDIAKQCLAFLAECNVRDSNLSMEAEFVECQLMVKELGERQEAYTASAIEIRLAAIKRMDQALENAVRAGNANTVQGACATQWNLCLPLLQRNLRKHVRGPLSHVADALQDISSLQVHLRCQVHTELAKCEEAVEQIEAAVKHLNKALALDESGLYHERLQTMLHRLQLSTQLYRSPDRAEDVAAIIIEQARKSSDSGTSHMKRSLLVKAGLALAPDAFQYVLDSEDEHKAKSGLKGVISPIQLLSARATQWRKCMKKAPGHLKRLGNENDRERARLWVDLTKTARQQQIWDVCRVAATFCLLYDDGRWRVEAKDIADDKSGVGKEKSSSKRGIRSAGLGGKTSMEDDDDDGRSEFQQPDADIIRMFAEVRFINGEALIQLLRDEGLKFNDAPIPPEDPHLKLDIEDVLLNEDWRNYADWIHEMNKLATDAFLRGIELGIELEESWIVCNAAVYLWNYNQHVIAEKNYKKLVPVFENVLLGLQKVGHSSIAILLSRICDVIAKGLLTPWIPNPNEVPVVPATTAKDLRKKTGGKGAADKGNAGSPSVLAVNPDGMDDLNKALSVCEYALQVTNGSKVTDLIPTHVRHQVVATWVLAKQMLQQPIGTQYGTEHEKLPTQQAMTKALVLLEMLSLNDNGMMQFTVPELDEVCDVVEQCEWDDRCVELEVWTRLTKLAHTLKNHTLVSRCSEKALDLQTVTAMKKKARTHPQMTHKETTALEMLSLASCLMGESLMITSSSNPPARRQAMRSFVTSAKFANEAANFSMVMSATRRWWNAALPLITSPLERELLRPSVEAILHCIVQTTKYMKNEDLQKASSESTMVTEETGTDEVIAATGDAKEEQSSSVEPVDDRSVMAAMYGLLIQTYVDKGDWEKGLSVADRAIRHMPRTNHRLLLFKHRIVMKAKLGKSVESDIAKFKDESESYVASMWHRVALSSRDRFEQLSAFQKSIAALQSDDMRQQKFEYLLQLAAWMFSSEFSVSDTLNIIEWACDILLTMKFDLEVVQKKKKVTNKGKNKSGRLGKVVSRMPAPTASDAQTKDKEGSNEGFVSTVISEKLGVKLLNPKLTIDDMKSSKQLEGLIRSHVMMAMVCGRGTEQHRVHCQLAYSFVVRLWKIALVSAGNTSKNLPKPSPGDGERKSAKGGVKTVPSTSEKPKRKGPIDALPGSTTEWAVYEVPDEIKNAFPHDKTDCGMNKQNITCAGLTVFYLLQLADFLRDSGLNHLSLPVLSLASTITESVLGSMSWRHLIIIKQIIVCYELHLVKAAKYWENMTRHQFLPETEQVKSRQELELKEIYKVLAQQEEHRIRSANAESVQQIDEKKTSLQSTTKSSPSVTGPINLLGRKVGGVYPSEIWTDKARLLLKLGYYQSCRRLLNESLTVAEYYHNDSWRVDAYHVLADLAVHEGNTGQALQLIRKAQDVGGDELFWQENIFLLIDAITLNQNPSPADFLKVSTVADHSISCLDQLLLKRPTKKPTIGFLRASLQSHICLMKLNTSVVPPSEMLKKLDEAEKVLEEMGFHRKLAHIHIKHASILMRWCKDTVNQHNHILKAISLLRTSAKYLEPICTDALVIEGDKGISLPVCREYLNVQLHLVTTMLDAASLSIDEDRAIASEEAAKDELQRKVEDFIGLSKEYPDHIEEEWDDVRGSFLHQSITILTSMHTSIPPQHSLRAEWMYLYGRSLHLLSNDCFSLPTGYHWDIINHLPDSLHSPSLVQDRPTNITTSPGDGDTSFTENEEGEMEEELHVSEECIKLNKQSELSLRLLTHATEVLTQSVSIALSLQDLNVVSKASIELVECSAQFDSDASVAHLLLHQSAEFSKSMRSLLKKTCSDPTTSQFSSLFHQECWLEKDSISTGLHDCWVRRNVLQKLEEKYVAWRRLQLNPSHLSMIKDLPSSFNYVIIQPSPDQSTLYCALMAKSKVPVVQSETKGKSKEKVQSAPPPPRMFISRVPMDTNMHAALLEEFSDFQQKWMSFLLQREYQTHQLMTRKLMLKELSKDVAETNIAGNVLEDHLAEEIKLKEEFSKVLSEIEHFFNPISSFIHSKLIEPIASEAADHTPENPGNPEQIVILAPSTLHKYPLEALSCFQGRFLSSVSRDFSLQLLHSRYSEEVEEPSEKKARKGTAKTPKGGKKSARGSAKVAKEAPSGSRAIISHGVHFIVDPHNDASETEKHPPEQIFHQLLQDNANSVASKWVGLYGSESIPSIGQWEDMMQQSSMFIYYGMERFIAQYPPSKLPSLNLRSTQLFLIFDKAQSNKSFRRQSKVDVEKMNSLLSIEKPMETAMMLSVCGANAVCLNYLHTSSEDNAIKIQAFIEMMLQGKCVGEGVRLLALPPIKPNTPNPEEMKMGAETPVAAPESTPSVGEEEPQLVIDSSTFNFILFGLPNMLFT